MSAIKNVAPALFDITPSPSLLSTVAHGLYVAESGDLAIEDSRGNTPTLFAVTAGQTIPVTIYKVLAATTAVVKGYGA